MSHRLVELVTYDDVKHASRGPVPTVAYEGCFFLGVQELVTYDDVKHASRGLVPTVAYEGCFFLGVQGGLAVSCCIVLSDTRSLIVTR